MADDSSNAASDNEEQKNTEEILAIKKELEIQSKNSNSNEKRFKKNGKDSLNFSNSVDNLGRRQVYG